MQKDLIDILADMLQKISKYDGHPVNRADAEKMATRILRSAFSHH